tara:strand:- start:246 stop:569 length:324 start_codon:yes stop_codon:yes gene_type:complete
MKMLHWIGEAIAATPLHVPRLETLGQLLLAVVVILLRKEHVVGAPEHAAVGSDLGAAHLVQVRGVAVGVGRGSAILRVDQRGSALIPTARYQGECLLLGRWRRVASD